jgi:hypothetical protein
MALALLGGYAAAWAVTARTLFTRWRPGRVPVRCDDACCADSGQRHVVPCYRQMRKDLTRVVIDYDRDAITWAMLAAVVWPVLALAVAVAFRPRELDAERKAREKRECEEAESRKARLQAEISVLEKEADEQRDPVRITIARRDGGVPDQPGRGAAPAGAAGPAGRPGGGGAGG